MEGGGKVATTCLARVLRRRVMWPEELGAGGHEKSIDL